MRVCFRKSDNRILESQSGDHPEKLDVLVSNAVASGYQAGDVKVEIIPDAECARLIALQNVPTPEQQSGIDDAAIASAFDDASVTRAIVKELFALRNEVRVLKGQQQITLPQYKTAFKAFYSQADRLKKPDG